MSLFRMINCPMVVWWKFNYTISKARTGDHRVDLVKFSKETCESLAFVWQTRFEVLDWGRPDFGVFFSFSTVTFRGFRFSPNTGTNLTTVANASYRRVIDTPCVFVLCTREQNKTIINSHDRPTVADVRFYSRPFGRDVFGRARTITRLTARAGDDGRVRGCTAQGSGLGGVELRARNTPRPAAAAAAQNRINLFALDVHVSFTRASNDIACTTPPWHRYRVCTARGDVRHAALWPFRPFVETASRLKHLDGHNG